MNNIFGVTIHEIDLTWPFWIAIVLMLAVRLIGVKGPMKWLGSYGLAVGIVFCLFLDTWLGTLAQIEHGLFIAQKMYFESWLAAHRIPIFGRALVIPLPGGQLLMSLLAVNLMVGGIVRVVAKMRASRSTPRRAMLVSLIVAHLGVALLLLSGAVKLHNSDEGALRMFEGNRSSDYVSYHMWEIAIQNANDQTDVHEFLIPEEHFLDLTGDVSTRFTVPTLPFELELSHFVPNAIIMPKGPMWDAATPTVEGWAAKAEERNTTNENNFAAIYARVIPASGGQVRDAILWGRENFPFVAQAGGESWAISLRRKRYELPFEVELVDFVKADHARMRMAKEYRSDVKVIDDDETRALRIEMNEPLRKDGYVLFQSNWGPQDVPNPQRFYSVFTVVRNPSDKWPEIGMWVLSIAMLIALGIKLYMFLGQQRSRATRAANARGDA
tara:strand:+ start:9007 stop:10326 length:1320 start_codon:yes stop_codon:yes gene_type:complete